jgi:PKD repeat protein
MRAIGLLAVVTGTLVLTSSCSDGNDLTPPENAAPVANFELPACTIDQPCEFVSTSTDDAVVTGWSWDFNGDNTPDANTATAAYTYRTAGTFYVSLTVVDAEGLNHRKTSSITIDPASVNTPPTAGFTHTCNGPSCTFANTSSDATPGTIATYAWTFGDNATSDQPSPTHDYAVTVPTEFTVTLTVTDNEGATDTETQTFTVTPAAPVNPPTAAFTFTCTLLVCNFVSTSTDVAPGTIVSYAWAFGDGGTAAVNKPSHTYSVSERSVFTVTLTVTDNDGGTAVATKTVTVDPVPPLNNPPEASFSYACAAAACTFTSTATDPEGPPIAAFAWTFGDGAQATGNIATHTYAITAITEFTVTLTVTDVGGATAAASQTISVNPDPSANSPPTASFEPNCYGEGCAFINKSTDAAPGAIVSYAWTYGDGATSSRNTACFPWTERCGLGRHVYSITGPTTFTVTLTVTDNLGAVAVASKTITVKPLPPAVQGCTTSGKIVECVLDIPTRSSLVLNVLGVSCDLGGQNVSAPPPVLAVMFINVCNKVNVGDFNGIFAGNDEGRYLYQAGTQARIWFRQSDKAGHPLNPPQGRLEGNYPNWKISIEDGDHPGAPGEPDFADFVLGVQATAR